MSVPIQLEVTQLVEVLEANTWLDSVHVHNCNAGVVVQQFALEHVQFAQLK